MVALDLEESGFLSHEDQNTNLNIDVQGCPRDVLFRVCSIKSAKYMDNTLLPAAGHTCF